MIIMSQRSIPISTRVRITLLGEQGVSTREIARQTQVSRRGVQTTLRRYKQTGGWENRAKKPKNRVTTRREDSIIHRMSERDRHLTAVQITSAINEQRNKKISIQTIKRRLAEAGLKGRRPRKKPLLSEKNMKARLQWARQHQDWTVDDWSRIIWSDECNIEVIGRINPKLKIY